MAKRYRNFTKHQTDVCSLMETNENFCIFDCETTGLEDDAEIIQFSAMLCKKTDNWELEPVETLDLYIKPKQLISKEIEDLTGITNEQLQFAQSEEQVALIIHEFINRADVWVGQNIPFDILKVAHMDKRTGIEFQEKPYIDTLKIARNMLDETKVKNHKLKSLYEYFYPEREAVFHNALEDVKATKDCASALTRLYRDTPLLTCGTQKLDYGFAYYWKNPKMGSMRRINVYTASKQRSGIFWDLAKKCWSCMSDKKSQTLFDQTDLAHLEMRVLQHYGHRYGNVTTMDDLGREWERSINAKNREEKQKAMQQTMTQPIVVEPLQMNMDEAEIEIC